MTDSTILTWMMLLPVFGALVLLILPATKLSAIRHTATAFAVATFALSLVAAGWFDWSATGTYGTTVQLKQDVLWIASLGVHYYVGVDGLSMPLLLLTTSITVLACLASYSIEKYVRGYFILLMLLLAGMIGVFVALDMMLFYVFFEISLFPMYFLIGIWGGPRKEYAAIKFFLYTLLGSVGILIVILGIWHFATSSNDPTLVDRPFDLLNLSKPAAHALFTKGAALTFANVAFWLLFVGFAVKVPSVPLHTWLPDAHVEAPTPISMILAAVLLKMGGYGLMRISYPLFPSQAVAYWFPVAIIGVVSLLYGAFCAMAQKDFKKLVAYSSISHMGYVVLGLAVLTPMAMTGAMFQMIAHGISSAMMFFIVGVIYERAHHRDINKLGGLWSAMPNYTGWAAVGIFASMGLPGLCGFIGELLVLLGTFRAAGDSPIVRMFPGASSQLVIMGVIAAITIIFTAGYLLWTLQRVYMGVPRPEYSHYARLSRREQGILATFAVAAVLFGVLPSIVLKPLGPTIGSLQRLTEPPATAEQIQTPSENKVGGALPPARTEPARVNVASR